MKIKNRIWRTVLCINAIILFVFISCSKPSSGPSFSLIEKGFHSIPDSIQTSVYWYWISDNISDEGVIRDLEAMKKAGINRAFIGNIGLKDVPYGNVKMLSAEWWSILHTAMKKAGELGIEIGVFNCPGWSQSGGPWISSDEAMRYLASSIVHVTGPAKISMGLEKPAEEFKDVKVIAFRAPENYGMTLNKLNATAASKPGVKNIGNVFDNDPATTIDLPQADTFIIDIVSKAPYTARSISIQPSHSAFLAKIAFQLKDSGKYSTISEFEINRSNTGLNVGFDPFAPVTVSFPDVSSRGFRVIFKDIRKGSGIAEIRISSAPAVERYSEKTLAKMHPTALPYWRDYQWPVQPEYKDTSLYIDPSGVIDISKYMSADGNLDWEVPEGTWVIMRTGMTPTGTMNSPASPEATGYEVDKMSRKHAEKHFDAHMGEIIRRIPEQDRKTFRVVVEDSYETGGQNFTDEFIGEFIQRYGYDPVPYFPAFRGLVVKDQRSSDRFLWDVRRMVADKVAYDYVGGLRDISHKNGLRTWLENYGHWGFPGEFLMYGGQSDEIGGEFWSEGELGNIENRAASSCGHIYGKTKISAESNTCAGNPFSRYPAVIKQRGDRFFAEGINNTLLHVYITQPYEEKNPGMNAWFGNEFNRKNTWFSQIEVYTQYLKRSNFMLQQGLNVADAAYFIGEDAPKMTGITDPSLPVGYQFDYINAEVIEKYMKVKNGLLTLPHGTQYRILVLPKLKSMRPELLSKIRDLIADGAVVLGPAPEYSPSLQNQPEADRNVLEMSKEIWGHVDGVEVKSGKFGKGLVINGMNMREALALIDCPPDCALPDDNKVHYGHRKLDKGDIYFISNQTAEKRTVTPEFRITGMQPELWLPATGSVRKLGSFEMKEKSTAVPLCLEPFESAFIVFRNRAGKAVGNDVGSNFPQPQVLNDLRGPWIVTFDTIMRGPDEPVVFETLSDWTASADERIKYYSGTAVYAAEFNIDKLPSCPVFIDLGKLTAMAKVYINGQYAGGTWTSPYTLEITGFARSGRNDIRIEVVNTWMNRLIGDSRLPVENRPTWCPVNPYKPDVPLQPSGLFGPVRVVSIEY